MSDSESGQQPKPELGPYQRPPRPQGGGRVAGFFAALLVALGGGCTLTNLVFALDGGGLGSVAAFLLPSAFALTIGILIAFRLGEGWRTFVGSAIVLAVLFGGGCLVILGG